MNRRPPLPSLLLVALALTLSPAPFAQSSSGSEFQLTGHVFGGGDLSAAGDFHLFGRIAQTDSATSTGATFTLTGGFLPPLTIPLPPGDILLTISLTEAGIQISWPPHAADFTLESTSALGPNANWQSLPGASQTSILIQPTTTPRFFRITSR